MIYYLLLTYLLAYCQLPSGLAESTVDTRVPSWNKLHTVSQKT